MPLSVVVLAAGKGSRMKSSYPKVLHQILRQPMIHYVLDCVSSLDADVTVVVGYKKEMVIEAIDEYDVSFVVQDKQLGTAHALSMVMDSVSSKSEDVLVLNGDLPALREETLKGFVNRHIKSGAELSFISADFPDPSGYGRVVRDSCDWSKVEKIVEEKDATKKEKEISEVNAGVYCIKTAFLQENLKRITSNNRGKEYYITDLIGIAVEKGVKVCVYKIEDFTEVLGVNTRSELATVEEVIKYRINEKHMRQGVSIVDPSTTYISPKTVIGADTIIYPNTFVYGKSKISSFCYIGPSVYIADSEIGKGCIIKFSSFISGVKIKKEVSVGPFSHLRPNAVVGDNVRIGNFVEIKNSTIGKGSKVPHLSYLGDASVGKNVNVGAGTITCNYDGVSKHPTVIEDGAFIGSDTMMVAPVRIGKNATTAAGSTITRDVSNGSLAIARAKQVEIKNWAERKKRKVKKEK